MGHLHCLKQIALFAQLSDAELATVAAEGSLHHAAAGELLFRAGDPAERVYIVKTGRVKLYSLDAEGRSFTLAVAGPDGILGQEAAFSRKRYSVYAETIECSCLWVFRRAALVRVLREHPELALSAVEALSAKLAETEERLAEWALGDVRSRTLYTLRHLAETDGLPAAGGVALRGRWTHQELGDLINASRPTVTSVLHELAAEGLIRLDGRRIVVCERAADAAGSIRAGA